jgi:hypothetical protein
MEVDKNQRQLLGFMELKRSDFYGGLKKPYGGLRSLRPFSFSELVS